jgi:Fe-S-cluster-containing hydrogenase component 2
MTKKLLIYPEDCVGCRLCEIFCSLSHTDTCNPVRSRVNVVKMNLDVHCIPMMCQQCDDPACQASCPSGAIFRNPTTGAMETDEARCIVCRMCVAICPFGATGVDPFAGGVFRCDLCDGSPLCAEVCPQGAIVFIEEERQALHKQRAAAITIMTAIQVSKTEINREQARNRRQEESAGDAPW